MCASNCRRIQIFKMDTMPLASLKGPNFCKLFHFYSLVNPLQHPHKISIDPFYATSLFYILGEQ